MEAEKQEQFLELETAVDRAIAVCDGDPRATVRALVIANNDLTKELEYVWQLCFARILTAEANVVEINRVRIEPGSS